MSYILDALRRAQAERERGQVPGLHAQPGLGGAQRARSAGGAAAPASAGAQRRLPAWGWGLLGGAVVAVLTVPLWLSMRGSGAKQPGLGTGPVATAVAPAAAPVAAPTVAATAVPPQLVMAPVTPPLVVVSAVPKPQTPKPAAGGLPVVVAPAPRVVPAEVAASASNPPPAAASLPPPLTAEQRRDWPPLAVGGSVWSDTPSARFVILGGQVVREGETTADGVLVERITPKAVVLRWRDQRGSLPM